MATRIAVLSRLRRFILSLPVLIIAGLVLLYALAGFFLAPYLIKREIPRFAKERLNAQASLAETEYLLILSTDLQYIEEQEAQRTLIALNEIGGMLTNLRARVSGTPNSQLPTPNHHG